jgi:hypothetical protein
MAGGQEFRAARFLAGLFPKGPRKTQIIALQKGVGPVVAENLHPEVEASRIVKLIEEHNNVEHKCAIYFGINETLTPGKKAKAVEIGHVRGFHVDIDCGEDKEAQKAALAKLTTSRPAGVPEPTAIVSSGGGFWAFWMLAEPIAVNGDVDLIDNLTDVNRRFTEVFEAEGGDSCFDISRIARLPGSVNWGSLKGGGRTDKIATVVLDDWSGGKPRRYALTDFSKLPAGKKITGAKAYDVAGVRALTDGRGRSCPPPAPAVSFSELGYEMTADGEPMEPDDLAAVIVQGPDARDLAEKDVRDRWRKPGGGWDRSLAVLYVAAELDRRGIDPGLIARVLLERTWAISDHLYDHAQGDGARPTFKREMYARRQVERAMESNDNAHAEMVAAPEPPWKYADAREWMNARFATVENYGNNYRVMSRPGVDDPVLPAFLTAPQWARRFDGFATGILDKKTGDLKPAPLANVWLGDKKRDRRSRVVFDPAGDDPDQRVVNLWTGFLKPNEPTDCKEYLALTREVIAGGSEEVFDYLISWMALRVQKPGMKMEVAIALQGGQGWGKSVWVELFGELFGPHFVAVSGAHGLASNFNKHLLQALLVFGDEMNAAGDKATVARLKTLVTQTHIQIEPKGVDSFTAPNRFAMVVSSNNAQVIDIDPDDRRWLALEVQPSWKGDLDRFAELVRHWGEGGGREAFYRHLMDLDLGEFNHRRRPITRTHTEQVTHSFTGAMKIVHAMLDRGETPKIERLNGVEHICPHRLGGEVFVPSGDLLDWARRKGLYSPREGNIETALGREMAKASALEKAARASVYGRQVRGIWLAPLAEARSRWAGENGLEIEWAEDGGSWDVIPDCDPPVASAQQEVPF